MNKKGYTLIEVLIVIAIIATIGVLATVNLDKIISNSKEDKYDAMMRDITEAVNTYITIYEEELSNNLNSLYNNETSFQVSISTLQDVLLLDDPLKDPRNNKTIDGNNTFVTITYVSASPSLGVLLGDISYIN